MTMYRQDDKVPSGITLYRLDDKVPSVILSEAKNLNYETFRPVHP